MKEREYIELARRFLDSKTATQTPLFTYRVSDAVKFYDKCGSVDAEHWPTLRQVVEHMGSEVEQSVAVVSGYDLANGDAQYGEQTIPKSRVIRTLSGVAGFVSDFNAVFKRAGSDVESDNDMTDAFVHAQHQVTKAVLGLQDEVIKHMGIPDPRKP